MRLCWEAWGTTATFSQGRLKELLAMGGYNAAPTAECQTPLQTHILTINILWSPSGHWSGEQLGQPASSYLLYSKSQLPLVNASYGIGIWAHVRGSLKKLTILQRSSDQQQSIWFRMATSMALALDVQCAFSLSPLSFGFSWHPEHCDCILEKQLFLGQRRAVSSPCSLREEQSLPPWWICSSVLWELAAETICAQLCQLHHLCSQCPRVSYQHPCHDLDYDWSLWWRWHPCSFQVVYPSCAWL